MYYLLPTLRSSPTHIAGVRGLPSAARCGMGLPSVSLPEHLSRCRDGSEPRRWVGMTMRVYASLLSCLLFVCYLGILFVFRFRMAMTRRTMFQKGEVHNKPSGFWGMIKSITTSAPGSESILHPSASSFFPITFDTQHYGSLRCAP